MPSSSSRCASSLTCGGGRLGVWLAAGRPRVDVNCVLCSLLVASWGGSRPQPHFPRMPTVCMLAGGICQLPNVRVGLDLTLTSLEVIVSRSSPLSSIWIVVASSAVLGSLCEGLTCFDFARLDLT